MFEDDKNQSTLKNSTIFYGFTQKNKKISLWWRKIQELAKENIKCLWSFFSLLYNLLWKQIRISHLSLFRPVEIVSPPDMPCEWTGHWCMRSNVCMMTGLDIYHNPGTRRNSGDLVVFDSWESMRWLKIKEQKQSLFKRWKI